MFLHDTDILAPNYLFPLHLLNQEAAGIFSVLCSCPIRKAVLYIFKKPSPQASATFIDDISMAFGENAIVNCVLFHGWADGIYKL